MNVTEAQIKLIEAAEVVFAQHGYEGASVREITSLAGANIAAINYHFGSKAELFKAMVRYRIEPINEKRLKLLDQAYERSGGAPLEIEEVISIVVKPMISELVAKSGGKDHFMKAMGRGMNEEKSFMKDLHDDVLKTFRERIFKAIAHSLQASDIGLAVSAMRLMSCTLVGGMIQHGRADNADFADQAADPARIAEDLIAYISGGIRALKAAATARAKNSRG